MFKKKARWLWVLVCLSLFLANACAGSLTWFDYSQTGSRENQLGANLKAAHENKNWGQNPKYREAAGPLSGAVGASPAAWSVWKLTPKTVGEGIASFTLSSTAKFEFADDEYGGHAYVQWAASAQGPWQTIYRHYWQQAGGLSFAEGTVKLDEPLKEVFVRIAADRISANKYNVGSAPNLMFLQWKAAGETSLLRGGEEVVWYKFGTNTGVTMRDGFEQAYQSVRWAPNGWGEKTSTSPTLGCPIASPAAWQIWRLQVPVGKLIVSVTSTTGFQHADGNELNDHVYVDWGPTPEGPWTRIYSHAWQGEKNSWSGSKSSGTAILPTPLEAVYIRTAADKLAADNFQHDDDLRFQSMTLEGIVVEHPQAQAALKEISLNGEKLAGYKLDQLVYNIELPLKTVSPPKVTAKALHDGAQISIAEAKTLPGTAQITVAEDGVSKNYVLNLTVATKEEIVWYDFGRTDPTMSANIDQAYYSENWAPNNWAAKEATSPTNSSVVGETPSAWQIWRLESPQGAAIDKFTVTTVFQYGKGEALNNHVYVDWSADPRGPWNRIYAHTWPPDGFWPGSENTGTVVLPKPLTAVYVRTAADRPKKDVFANDDELRFQRLEIRGAVSLIPPEEEKQLRSAAELIAGQARKAGIPLPTFQYKGANYRLDLGKASKVTVLLKDGTEREIFKNFYCHIFENGWQTTAFSQDKLLSYEILESSEEKTVLDTYWKLGGARRDQAAIEVLFHLWPYYFQADVKIVFTGSGVKWGERGFRLVLGKDRVEGFSSGDAGVRVTFTPRENRLWGGTLYSDFKWVKTETGEKTAFSVFFEPYVTGEPQTIPAPAHLSGDPAAGLVGADLVPTEKKNIFFEGEKPFVNLVAQNHATEEKVLDWTIEATDFFKRERFIQKGQLRVPGKGAIREQQIQLPEWKGHINVALKAQAETETIECQSRVAVIPSPERKYKAKSIFGMLPWSGTMPLKLDMMEWLGVHWVRGINPQTEDINEYRRRGLEPIPNSGSMDKAPAGTFLFTEMENEPNFGTLAVEYAEKLKLNYLRQRKHDPNIAVGLAGIAGVDAAWVRELAENGCWDYLDLLHVHLHCFPYAPEVDRTISRYFWLASAVARLFPIMNEYGYKPLVDSEQGYLELDPDNRVESYPLSMVSREDMAAAFTVRSYLEGMAYGLLGKHWFTMMPYGGFGLIYQDTPRAAFSAYAAMTKLMDGAEYWGELINFESYQGEEKTGAPLVTWFGAATPQLEDDFLGTEQGDLAGEVDKALEPRLYQRVFKMQDGEPLLVAWATLRRTGVISERIDTLAWKDQSPGKSLAWDGTELKSEPEPLDIVINVGSPQVKVADLMGNMRTVDCPGGKLHLKVDDFPQYIYGAAKELLAVAHDHQYKRFPQEIKLTQGSEVVQLLLPPGGKFLRRKSVYDQENIAAKLVKGQPAAFTVRITNVSEKAAAGVIKLQLPAGWSSEPQEINFKAPAGQQIISEPFTVTPSGEGAFKLGSTVTVEGEKVGDSVMNVLVTAQ